MRNFFCFIAIIAIPFMLNSCSEDKPVISEIPAITLIGVSPNPVREYKDSIIFTLSYTDGNGDLGENNAEAKNVFITDTRIFITDSLRIPQLAPANVPITGKINVVLKNTIITDSSSQQNVSYEIIVVDRAGNKSNTITTGNISVVK